MGYDMTTFAGMTPAEQATYNQGRARWVELVKVRDATLDPVERKEAQKAVEEAWPNDPSYFRLNIGGMGRYLDVMERLNMIHWNDNGIPDWSGEPVDDDELERRDALPRDERLRALYERERRYSWAPEVPAMCGWKFTSNDPWLIGPVEISCALKAFADHDVEEVSEMLIDAGWTKEQLDYWFEWIAFLQLAVERGGIVQG